MNLSLKKLQPFRIDCQVAGIFLFLPYILNTGILDIVQGCALPESGDIGKQQAALSIEPTHKLQRTLYIKEI